MTSTVNGHSLLAAIIVMRLTGAWYADVQLDSTEALTGSASVEIDGVTFVGTVSPETPAIVEGGRCKARIIGGAGGLGIELEAANYVNVTVRGVLSDILRETGEKLSSTSEEAILGATLARWERSAGPARLAIDELVERAGANWRVLGDGTIWVGRDTWPVQTIDHVHIDRPNPAVVELAPERPDLRPGVTFNGQQVRQVNHYLLGKLRTDVYFRSVRDALQELFAPLRREIDYSRLYPCRVAAQNADGTLQLVPDDGVVKGKGLDKVPVAKAYPGDVRFRTGARVMLGFDAGDPSRPYAVASRGAGTELASATIGNPATALPVGRQGDGVAVFIPTSPVSGGFGVAGVPAGVPPGIWVYGTISSGSPVLKAS